MTSRNIPKGSTSHKTQEEVTEYFDDEKKMSEDAKKVAKLLKESKHCVIYTGAGVSTSANIPDYRGPNGVWTLRDSGKTPKGIRIDQAFPTYCHYAIVELQKKGYVKHVVSTNVDGLHRRSGVPRDDLSELHGNCYKEYCSKCGTDYLRYYDVTQTVDDFRDHITGRKCEVEKCGGDLKDTIIHFGENLPENELKKTVYHAQMSDVSLVLGTSMRVSPANKFPTYNKKTKLVIVNLQNTPFDDMCTIRCHSKTDGFMKLVMEELGLSDFDQSFDANSEKKIEIKTKKDNKILEIQKPNLKDKEEKYTDFELEREKSGKTGFAVFHKKDCPHLKEHMGILNDLKDVFKSKCKSCDEKSENWMCLKCGEIGCSRYKNSHMKEHYDKTGHLLSVSLMDLSFWCYSCQDYIDNPQIGLQSLRNILEEIKFPSKDSNRQEAIDKAIQELFK